MKIDDFSQVNGNRKPKVLCKNQITQDIWYNYLTSSWMQKCSVVRWFGFFFSVVDILKALKACLLFFYVAPTVAALHIIATFMFGKY